MDMNTKTLVGIIVLLAVLGVLGYFFMWNKEDRHMEWKDDEHMDDMHDKMDEIHEEMADEMDDMHDEMHDEMMDDEDASEVLEITVEGENYAYNPSTITVKQGQKVRLTFKSTDGFHDFVIDEIPGAQSERIQTGQETVIEFTPTETGSFAYYCSVGSHRALGMEGTLIVE